MKTKGNSGKPPVKKAKDPEKQDLPGYPDYAPGEDIYSKYERESDVNPEDISRNKEPTEDEGRGSANEKDFPEDVSGSDLDVPGSELDDDQEKKGSEDEENNYYSLGGDDHEDLDEDKGD